MGIRLKPIIGIVYGNYTVISEEVFKIKDKNKDYYRGYFKVKCLLCNTEHLVRSDTLKSQQAKKCRACSNKEKYLENVKNKIIDHKGYSVKHQGSGNFSKTHLLQIKYGAEKRNLDWDSEYMTTENLWELMILQNHKCSLSGLDLTLSKGENIPILTEQRNLDYDGWNASLDRINSKKGYIKGNVQWVHRHINIMKNQYPQEYFIELCQLITNKNNKINE